MNRKKKSDNKKGISSDIVKKIWKAVSPRDWYLLFTEIAPNQQWILQGNTSLRGCCPYHVDNTPSFTLSFQKSMAICYNSSCGKVTTDIVNLIARLKNISYTEALLFLRGRFNLSEIASSFDDLNEYQIVQEMKKAAAIAFNQVITEGYRDKPAHLSYCNMSLTYLVKARKLSPESLLHIPVGIFPKPEHAKKYIKTDLHTAYDEYFKKYNNYGSWGAIVFTYNDSPDTISRFKIKPYDHQSVLIKKDIEILTESELRSLYPQSITFFVADPYTDKIGVFGLHKYQKLIGKINPDAYATKGEFDVLSVMAAQDKTANADFMLFGTSGSGSTDIGFLREYGVKTAWLIPDHPIKNGDEWVLTMLSDQANFTSDIEIKALNIKIFQWPMEILGNDLDEAMHSNGYATMFSYLYQLRNSHFLNAAPWITGKCEVEVTKVIKKFEPQVNDLDPTDEKYGMQRANIFDEQRRELKEVLLKWFKYIHDPAAQLAFARTFKTITTVDISQIDVVSNTINQMDNVDGACRRIVEEFEKFFAVSYYEKRTSGNLITLWARSKDEPVELHMSDKQLYSIIAMYVGESIVSWFDKILYKNPVYLSGVKGVEDKLSVDRIKRENARELLIRAVETLMGKAVNISELTILSQGIHHYDLPQITKNKRICYFINGKSVFKGIFAEEEEEMTWEKINNATDEMVFFSNLSSKEKWSEVIEADLPMAHHVDHKKNYSMIVNLLDRWKFKDHEVMSRYLAAYILSLPIMRAVGNVSITFVTGQKESGKTCLVQGLLGGIKNNHHDVPPILESAVFTTDASGASVYQTMSGSSLTFVLDEAEMPSSGGGSSHDEHMKDILKHLFSITMGGALIRRGGATADQRTEYFLRMPVLMAAINEPPNTTFISRLLMIYTMKEIGRIDPATSISNDFTDDQITQLRKEITIGLIPHIPEIIRTRNILQEKLPRLDLNKKHKNTQDGEDDGIFVSNRFINNILTPLAVYEFINGGAEDLYRDIVWCYKDKLKAINGQDSQSDLINACLYNESIKKIDGDNIEVMVSAKSIIVEGKDIPLLNKSETGIYFMEKQDWIVIVWKQAKHTILKHSVYRNMEESALKERTSKFGDFIENKITNAQHKEIIKELNLRDVGSPAEYTVIKGRYLKVGSEEEKIEAPARTNNPEIIISNGFSEIIL